VQNEWSDTELYWIADNGIKLSGMPAFGSNYEKQEIAALTAFVRRLPKVSPEQYREMAGTHTELGERKSEEGYPSSAL
jgi:mono/diheme cytochrome c family protein